MKQKLEIDQKAQKVLNVGMWLIIVLFLILGSAMVSEAKAAPEKTETVVTIEAKPKNKEVARYHRRNNKRFTCSLCPPKGLRRLLPKKWR